MGDDIQALKAGIMEIADIFVINKSDRPGVEKLERSVRAMLELAHRPDGWTAPIVRTVATTGVGIDQLIREIDRCYEAFQTGAASVQRKRQAARQRLLALLEEQLVRSAVANGFAEGELDSIVARIAERELDPYTIVETVVGKMKFSG
jgi:LAO/AO transport system kinase